MPFRALYRVLFRRHALERDMQEDMAAHLEASAHQLVRRGLSATSRWQGIRIVRGRDFTLADTAGVEMSVLVNTELARGYWGASDPIGKRLESRRDSCDPVRQPLSLAWSMRRLRPPGGAIGCSPPGRQVAGPFFLSGVRLSIVGTALGLPLSVAALYLVTSQFGQTLPLAMPPVAIGLGVMSVVVGVASLASWIPARHASGVAPLVAMRAE